ncbi:hypothetical protein C241_04523 [Bradyrhizobium lupini HPC(L)]|uniref:Response regulator n=1 Tax=Bradyrhizobium lupini HPC(L) TaxID=1229491 RepID=A0ABP2RWF1_RHILU|nr:hypothetical protein C241_04523 [Bradyrhizobium lupini HPC(L)]
MPKLVYVDEQRAERSTVRRLAVQSGQFSLEEVVPLEPTPELDDMVELIVAQHCDVLVTDYRLNEEAPEVKYSGSDLVKELQARRKDFPCFIATSHPSDASVTAEDMGMIFDKEEITDEEGKTIRFSFFERVTKQVEAYRRRIERAKEEHSKLSDMAAKGNATPSQLEELLNLDDFLEASIAGHHRVPKHLKQEALDPLIRLIGHAEDLVSKLQQDTERKA